MTRLELREGPPVLGAGGSIGVVFLDAVYARHDRLAPEAAPSVGRVVLVSACLAALSLVVSLIIMRELEALGFFHLNDVLFDSDTRGRVAVFSIGELIISILPFDLPSTVHPYLSLYVMPVIRTIAKSALFLGLTDMSELQLRVALAAFVSPLVLALQSFFFGVLLFLLGFRLQHVVLISLLHTVAFSNLIFGAIPEHSPIASLSIILMLVVAVAALRFPSLDRLRVWIPLGVFAAGVTISNVAFLGIVHLFTGLFCRREPPARRLAKSALLAVSIFAFVLATEQAMIRATGATVHPGAAGEDFVSRFMRPDEALSHRLARAAAAVGNAVAPARSGIRTLEPPGVPGPLDPSLPSPFRERSPYPRYTLEAAPGTTAASGILGLIAPVGMGLGAALMLRRGGAVRVAAAIALAILAFNVVLHSAWGTEFFLYSQHWISASLVLLAGLLLVPARLTAVTASAVALFTAVVAANNGMILWDLISGARAAAGAIPG